MTIDNNLKFKAHIRNIEGRIARSVGVLSEIRHLFPSSALLFLYYALIHPHLSSGVPIWGSTYSTYIQKLQRLQNKAISIISNASRKISVTPLCKKYGDLKLVALFNYERPKLCTSFLNKPFPHNLIAYLTSSLSCMNAAQDLKLSQIFIFPNSQPFDAKILLNCKDQRFGTL